MEVKKLMEKEKNRLIAEILPKFDWAGHTELKLNDFLYFAEKQGIFSQDEYIYTENEDTLLEMLTYSLGLSNLWYKYCEQNPNPERIKVNYILITYIEHMWGLDRIERKDINE